MKIRMDFVSNSSSCSFIVKDPADAAFAFSKAFADVSIPYDFDEKISVSAHAKNKWFRQIEKDLTSESSFEDSYIGYSDGKRHFKDPDAVGWDSINLTLGHLANAANHMESYAKLTDLHFSCDDYDTGGVTNLKSLYDFFKRNGCDVDASDSEIEFTDVKTNEFITRLGSFTVHRRSSETSESGIS